MAEAHQGDAGKPERSGREGPKTRKKPRLLVERISTGGTMARYGKGAQKSVKRAMHKRKKGSLRSGKSGKKVKSRKQAIAIGLSEARKKGRKVPPKQS
jgi:hypothetical protein